MGTLGGHLIPGTFFILFGVWWSIITSLRYYKSKSKSEFRRTNNNSYKSTVTMPCIFLPCGILRKAPIESYIKFFLPLIAAILEFYTGLKFHYDKIKQPTTNLSVLNNTTSTNFTDITVRTWTFEKGNLQHITMYSAFMFSAVVEIMIYHSFDLPSKIEYAFGMLAFSIEAFLFGFHLHGKDPVDIYLHVILIYAIFGCIFCTMLEFNNPKRIIYTYGRILFTILQGTWFWQVGFMLYPPTDNPKFQWDLSDHGNIMVITVFFCWHVLILLAFLVGQLWLTKRLIEKYKFFRDKLNELILIDEDLQAKTNNVLIERSYDYYPTLLNNRVNLNDNSEEEDVTFDSRTVNKI